MSSESYATLTDIQTLFRALTNDEQSRATALLPVVSDLLRQEAMNRNRDLDEMIAEGKVLESTVKSVTVDIIARTLMTSTSQEPMTQMSQAGGGYSASGSFLNPGGGVFIKKSEIARLGLARQTYGGIELYSGGGCNDCAY